MSDPARLKNCLKRSITILCSCYRAQDRQLNTVLLTIDNSLGQIFSSSSRYAAISNKQRKGEIKERSIQSQNLCINPPKLYYITLPNDVGYSCDRQVVLLTISVIHLRILCFLRLLVRPWRTSRLSNRRFLCVGCRR